MLNVHYFPLLIFCFISSTADDEPCPTCQPYDCFHNRQIYDIEDTFSLKYFYFSKDCIFVLRIPDFAYFTLNYSIHSEIVDLSTVVSEVDEFFNFQYRNVGTNIVLTAPTLVTDWMKTRPFSYFEEFTVKRNDLDLFKKVERIIIANQSEPRYIQMNDLVPGVTYIYESENWIRVWRPSCETNRYHEMPESYRMFLFNGTDKKAKPIGNLGIRFRGDDECRMGMAVPGLIILATEPLNYSNPEMAKLLIMDKSVVDNFYPMSIFFFDWNWNVDGKYMVYSGDANDEQTIPRYLVMTNYQEAVKYEFLFLLFADWDKAKKQKMPLIEVYTGWPSGTKMNTSNVIATYSEDNRFTHLPQRFQGAVFTFVIWQPTMMNDLGPLFISPLINGSSLMNTSSYNEVSILNPIFTYGKRELRDLEPFSGRKGLIRSDWLDGSAEKRPGTLELYENINSTVFNFTFTFEPGCQPDAILVVTTVSDNFTDTNHTFSCSYNTSLTVRSTALSAKLYGGAIVRYFIMLPTTGYFCLFYSDGIKTNYSETFFKDANFCPKFPKFRLRATGQQCVDYQELYRAFGAFNMEMSKEWSMDGLRSGLVVFPNGYFCKIVFGPIKQMKIDYEKPNDPYLLVLMIICNVFLFHVSLFYNL